MTRQLKSTRDIRFYPLEKVADGYRIPFSVKNMGLFSLPKLRLQYFNPLHGRIYTQQYALERFVVLSQWLVYLLELVLFAGVALLLRYVYKRLNNLIFVIRGYLQAVYKIQLADSASACKAGLMTIALAESWPVNLTLQKWQGYWNQKYPHLDSVSKYIQRLEEGLYSNKPDSGIETIRTGFLQTVYQRLPLLKLLVRIKFAKKALT